jgi:hypothetical protein
MVLTVDVSGAHDKIIATWQDEPRNFVSECESNT